MGRRQDNMERYSAPDYDAYVYELKGSQDASSEKKPSGNPTPVSDIQEELRKRASRRLMSLDALRGINMLCIIGLASLVTCICSMTLEDFRVIGDRAFEWASAFRHAWPGPAPETIAKHMTHVEWNGLLHHDTIFPLFLFLAGVSFPFSLYKQRANGRKTWRILLKILWRGFALVLLGIIYSNKVVFDFEHMRFMGVLQHIGLAWMFAALIFWPLADKTKTLLAVVSFILVSYWALVALVPAPDVAPREAFAAQAFVQRGREMFKPQAPYMTAEQIALVENGAEVSLPKHNPILEDNPLPDFAAPDYPEIGTVAHNLLPEGCVVNYIDRLLVPGKLYRQPLKWNDKELKRSEIKDYDPALFRNLRDPEGLASTWPAIATALLGMIFGAVLRREDSVSSKLRKVAILLLGGAVLLAIGYAWNIVFPVNKNLWNSTFVCLVGGYSAIVLALFYLVIDVFRLRWLGFPFAVIGMNSITIFVARRVIDFSNMRDFFFADFIDRFIPTSRTIIVDGAEVALETAVFTQAATYVASLIISWLFVFWLYRHKIFMRV